VAVALATYVAFPATPVIDSPLFEIGSVATDNVISPIQFRVPKSDADLQLERADAAQAIPPTFRYLPAAADSSLARVRVYMDSLEKAAAGVEPAQQAAAVRARSDSLGLRLGAVEGVYLANSRQRAALLVSLETAIRRLLANGVAPTGAMDTIRGSITLVQGDSTRTLRADSIITFVQFLARARGQETGELGSVGEGLFDKLLTTSFRPTIVPDRAATESRRAAARFAVSPWKFEVREQEAIARANQVIGPVEFEKMRALREALQSGQSGQFSLGRIGGAVLFNTLLVGIFGFAVFMFRPAIYTSFRSLLTVAAVFLVVILAAGLVARAPTVRPELVPIAVAGIIISILFDTRISTIAVMVLAVLIGGQGVFHFANAQFLNIIAGVAAVFSVRFMRQRNQAFFSMLSIALAYAFGALALGLVLDRPPFEILGTALYGGVNAVISVPLATLLLPLAEEFTGIDTYPRLLEWSDLNRPLMRQLSLEAPGTYAHTMTIANLAESACNAIGANGMLARVGSYYHDIGKLSAPHYFVENQARGRNPHDDIPPAESAAIIRNHVIAGMELGQKHRIPRTVRAFIPEHHGTGPITYFLEKSTEQNGPPENPDDYRYPGPIPQSKETAVVMLADAVEASARVLSEPTPQKLREVVDHIVKLRLDQGQLAEAPLTLREVNVIKEQFTRVLSAAHHTRIDYPASAGGVTAGFAS
jgi:hypothetical protein